MNEYIQEVLDVLWSIEGWKKDEIRNRVRVHKWLVEFPPEQINLVKVARKFDVWCEGKEIDKPTVSNFDSFIRTIARKGDIEPHPSTISGAIFSVEEQLRLKDVKRRAELERMGIRD